jgi:beta-lactamase class A
MIFAAGLCQAQYTPITFKHETSFDNEIKAIIEDLGLDKDFDVGEDGIEQISFALVDMNGGTPILSGYNYNNFIYPASVYKMYVAAEILHQISLGEYSLQTPYIIRTPNDVDKSKEISRDPRPLLKDGDTVTIEYLLDLMISRSDNSAANCLIDVATRPRINQMIQSFGWFGSEVTRKFLKRKFEDPGYDTIRSTETSALHAAEFLYRIHSGTLINYWVSSQMKSYLSRQLDKSKLATGLPGNVMMYHKTGWWSFWTHDVAIVDDGKVKYIITCFLPIEEDKAIPIMKLLSNKIHNLIKLRNY